MDTNTIAMIILFATFMIFMVLRVPVTFSMLGACVLTALYLGPKYEHPYSCVWVMACSRSPFWQFHSLFLPVILWQREVFQTDW